MPAYLIYDVEIDDPEPYAEFMERVKPLVEEMSGTYLARGGVHEVLEGDRTPTRTCCFNSPTWTAPAPCSTRRPMLR